MGINTLLPFLKNVTVKVNIESLKGQTAVVDASCWIHRALYTSYKQNGNESRLQGILQSYMDVLQRSGIKLFVVFDGLSLPAKERERAKRTRKRNEARTKAAEHMKNGETSKANKLLAESTQITYAMTTTFIKLCRSKNIDYIVAPYEADSQIAYLTKNGHADFAISEDSDLLAYGCQKVLFKMQMNGMFDSIELKEVLKYLTMTEDDFLHMCIIAGCDYLPNIKCVGINKAKKLVLQEADLMKALLKLAYVPDGYECSFKQAKAVFLHQTVIDKSTFTTIPLTEWEVGEKTEILQTLCGNLLCKEYTINLATGNINPEHMDIVLNTFQLLAENESNEDVNATLSPNSKSNQGTKNKDCNSSEMHVTVISVDEAWFSWAVPSFPVLSINLRKIKFRYNGEDYSGVVSKDANVMPGQYTCTSHCKINIDNEEYTVLWVVLPLECHSLEQDTKLFQNETDTDFKGPHTLPFKVMGTCYCSSRQDTLEAAYLNLNDYNRHVYAKLEEEPENVTDNEAIAVYISVDNYGENFEKVGYIAKELTQYLKPNLKQLDVSVCNIRFCTTYYRMGYYLTLEITKDGMWHKDVIAASKNVR